LPFRTFFAAIGYVATATALVAAVLVFTMFRGFSDRAGAVYWDMARILARTGDPAEATVWKRQVASGLSFAEVDQSIRSLAADRNLRDVGQLPLGEQVAAMQGKDWRSLQVYLFCNPLTAARMVEYSPAFAAYLPCRISLVEDGDGQLWLITMNMDLMLYGGRPLPDELREEAEGVRAAMLAVMDGAAEGAF